MVTSPWPMRVGRLLLREAHEDDIEGLLSFRNDPAVNRFMLRTSVDPEAFRREWLGMPAGDTDYSCVAELDGDVVAMGFLDVVDGMGQPGMPQRTEGVIGYIVEPGSAGKGVASDLALGLVAAAFDRSGAAAGHRRVQRRQPCLGAGAREGGDAPRAARYRGLVARGTGLGGRVPVRAPRPRVEGRCTASDPRNLVELSPARTGPFRLCRSRVLLHTRRVQRVQEVVRADGVAVRRKPLVGDMRWDGSEWKRWNGRRWTRAAYSLHPELLTEHVRLQERPPVTEQRRQRALALAVEDQVVARAASVILEGPGGVVLAYRRPVSHLFHAVMTLFTGGLWIVVWLALALGPREDRIRLEADQWGNVWPQAVATA